MNTSTEGEDVDDIGVPFLPSAPPTVKVSGPPSVPVSPVPPSPPSSTPAVSTSSPAAPSESTDAASFDARAMVESQKHFTANPAYGALPVGTEESREAAMKLRAEAQRKRRRNRLLGRAVAVLLLGGMAASGWFAYRAYQDQQARDAADRAAALEAAEADDSGAEEAAAALTPLGEQQQINDGLEDLNDIAQSSAGGLVGAVDDARELVGQIDDPDDETATADGTADGTSITADPFAARTVDFVYRRWETAAATSPMVEYAYSYDRVGDTYTGEVRPDDGTVTITGTDREYRYSIDSAGAVERVSRSGESLDPELDIAAAGTFGPNDVLPPQAWPFATLLGSEPDAEGGEAFTYTVDTEQWRDADPGSFLIWVTTWNSRPTDDPSFVDLDRREVGVEPADPAASFAVPTGSIVVDDGSDAPDVDLTFLIAADGHVASAAIVDDTADFRVEYALVGAGDAPVAVDLGVREWTPAP